MADVRLKSVTKRWGSVVAVHDFNLDIADREFVVLLGPSGCGKTTTMRMVAGLEDPTAGEITIGSRVVNDLEPKDRDVAMVFQNYGLYPNLSVYENIRFPLKVRRVDSATHDRRVRRAAAMVELDELLERRPRELSGGQRQRVALARAIVRQPAVFLMDEPLSNLDAKLRVSTRAQLKNLHHELGVTTIYVTHDQVEAMTLADRVVVMNRGELQQIGTPRAIYDRPANAFVAGFIGSPAMNLVPGAVASGVFGAEAIRVRGLVGAADGATTLGFRAEDVTIAAPADAAIAAPIYSVELLGDATLVTLRAGGALLAAKAGKDFRGRIGEPAGFRLAPEHCHLFDPASGRALRQAASP
jgi:multiple sugar transport system ATP-binding protein